MESVYKRCNNCGRPEHCGVSLWEEYRDDSLRLFGEIKVCDSCQCRECQERNLLWVQKNLSSNLQ